MKLNSNFGAISDRVGSISSIGSQEVENNIIVLPKREIVFKYYSSKEILADFQIINLSQNKKYYYRVLCTSSKSYKVEPYKGEINPSETINVRSTLISKGIDIEKRMKDQFKIEYVTYDDDLFDKKFLWSSPTKKEIKMSISIMFQKSNSSKSVSPGRSIPTMFNSMNGNPREIQNNLNRSQKSFQSPNQSQFMQNNSQISYTKQINSHNVGSPRANSNYQTNQNYMNMSNEFYLDDKSPGEESKFTPDSNNNQDMNKPLKLPSQYNQSQMEKSNVYQQQISDENQKYQQKFTMLKKRQEEQVELIKMYKDDIKKFHNEISKLKFIFRKNENKIENTSEIKSKFLLQPYQLSILIFAFLLLGSLLKMG